MKILTIFAHPDDETMLAGGTLALLARAGTEMHYLCATRGEGGELGEPPICHRHQIGLFRERELACALTALGGGSLDLMGYLDPLVSENGDLHPYTDDFDGCVAKIAAHLRKIQPDAVITHGTNGEYGHPGHILTHRAVRFAIETLGDAAPLFYTFCADYPKHPKPRLANKENPAHLVLDVSSVLLQKEKAAYCHRSQNALFVRRTSARLGYQVTVPEVLIAIESLHRVYPPVNDVLDDEVANLLKPWKIRIER